MPTYKINGKTVRSQNPLSDDEIDEIAGSMVGGGQSTVQDESEAAPQTGTQALAADAGNVAKGIGKGLLNTALGLGELALQPVIQPLKTIGKSIQGISAELQGKPSDQYKVGFEEAIPTALRQTGGAVGQSLGQAGEYGNLAVEAAKEGNLGEAAGRGIQAGLSAFPLTTGFVERGERFANADPAGRAQAGGEFIADLALAHPAADIGGISQRAVQKVGDFGTRLRAAQPQRYADGLFPKLRNEGLAEAAAKEAIDRGLWGGLDSLEGRASQELASHGPEIGRILGESPASVRVADSARGPLNEFGQSGAVGGVQQGLRDLQTAAAEELARLPEELPVSEAWRLRKLKEDPVVKKGAYLPGADPALSAQVEAMGVVADAQRGAIAEAVPEVAPHMKEYSFFQKIQDLVDQRKLTPETAINPFKAKGLLQAADPYRALQSFRQSTLWKTGSAVVLDRIGKLLEAGKIPEAVSAYKKAGGNLKELELPAEQTPDLGTTQNPDLEAFSAPASPLEAASSQAPQVWGGDVPEGFGPLPEPPMSLAEAAREAEFLRGNREAGINAEQVAKTREFRLKRNRDQKLRYDTDEELQNLPSHPRTTPETITKQNQQAMKEFQSKVRIDDLMKEFEQAGYIPDNVPLEGLSPQQLRRLEQADRKAALVAQRTIQNPTYKKLPILKSNAKGVQSKTRADVLRAIFERHREPILGQAKPVGGSGPMRTAFRDSSIDEGMIPQFAPKAGNQAPQRSPFKEYSDPKKGKASPRVSAVAGDTILVDGERYIVSTATEPGRRSVWARPEGGGAQRSISHENYERVEAPTQPSSLRTTDADILRSHETVASRQGLRSARIVDMWREYLKANPGADPVDFGRQLTELNKASRFYLGRHDSAFYQIPLEEVELLRKMGFVDGVNVKYYASPIDGKKQP